MLSHMASVESCIDCETQSTSMVVRGPVCGGGVPSQVSGEAWRGTKNKQTSLGSSGVDRLWGIKSDEDEASDYSKVMNQKVMYHY